MKNVANAKCFWKSYNLYREERLPIQSDLYEVLDKFYEDSRRSFKNKHSANFQRKIPTKTINFYNTLFDKAERSVINLFARYNLSEKKIERARHCYGARLANPSTLGDLMALDVFSEKTVNQDIHPEYVFDNIEKIYCENPHLISDTFHFFFHRPQQSKHIFYHEIVVGFLLNEVENEGKIVSPNNLATDFQNYSQIAAFTLSQISDFMKKDLGECVSIHLKSEKQVTNQLPSFIQELMLVASHIYWYLDFYVKKNQFVSPAEILGLVYICFVCPSIDKKNKRMRLKLKKRAGFQVEKFFFGNLYTRPDQDISRFDIAELLFDLSKDLWTE